MAPALAHLLCNQQQKKKKKKSIQHLILNIKQCKKFYCLQKQSTFFISQNKSELFSLIIFHFHKPRERAAIFKYHFIDLNVVLPVLHSLPILACSHRVPALRPSLPAHMKENRERT